MLTGLTTGRFTPLNAKYTLYHATILFTVREMPASIYQEIGIRMVVDINNEQCRGAKIIAEN